METSLDEIKLKKLLKEAIIEVFDERKDILQKMIIEALEDLAMNEAIREGERSTYVSREDIFKIIEG